MAEKNEKNEKDKKIEKIEKKETKSKENEEVVDKKVKETNKEESKAKKEKTSNEEKSTASETNKAKKVAEDIKTKAEEVEDKLKIDTEELKNETKDTVNQVKDVFKNGDFKEKTTDATNFLKAVVSNPFETIEEIATEKNDVFPKAVLLIILYTALIFVARFINIIRGSGYHSGHSFSEFVSSLTSPLLYILATSCIIFVFNRVTKSDNKKMTTIISTVTTCYIPIIVAAALKVVLSIFTDLGVVLNPLMAASRAIAIILLYFGVKNILDENDDKQYMLKFFCIYAIIQFVVLLLSNVAIIFSMANI